MRALLPSRAHQPARLRGPTHTSYFPAGETWRHLLPGRKVSCSMKCVEQLNKKYYIHSSILQQIPPEMVKSFPLVTSAARGTPIPLWEVNHCGGTAAPWSPRSHPAGRGVAPAGFQAAGLGAACCLRSSPRSAQITASIARLPFSAPSAVTRIGRDTLGRTKAQEGTQDHFRHPRGGASH